MADKAPLLSNMDTRQKVTAGIVGVVVLIIIWQLWGLFGGGGSSQPSRAPTPTAAMTPAPVQAAPKPTEVPAPQPVAQTPEEQAMMRMQVEAQQQYLKALTQLQMLRIAANIAETNKAIMADKFDTVKSEKQIVDLLSGPTQPMPSYGAALGAQQTTTTTTTATTPKPPPAPVLTPEVNYTVVSVTQTHDIWRAVIGAQGSLYNVKVGDVLPADGSTVVSISRNGVTIEKDGDRRRISLVPII